MFDTPSLFESLDQDDRNVREASRRALALAHVRVESHVGKFLRGAWNEEEFLERLALVQDDFAAYVASASEEVGHEHPEYVAAALKDHYRLAIVKEGCSCSDGKCSCAADCPNCDCNKKTAADHVEFEDPDEEAESESKGKNSKTASELAESAEKVSEGLTERLGTPVYARWRNISAIEIKPENKGLLHKKLNVPEGEKIPASKIEEAEKSGDEKTREEAQFAENAKKWHHGALGDVIEGNSQPCPNCGLPTHTTPQGGDYCPNCRQIYPPQSPEGKQGLPLAAKTAGPVYPPPEPSENSGYLYGDPGPEPGDPGPLDGLVNQRGPQDPGYRAWLQREEERRRQELEGLTPEQFQHPDPWMDNEPGSLTFPEHWAANNPAEQKPEDPNKMITCAVCGGKNPKCSKCHGRGKVLDFGQSVVDQVGLNAHTAGDPPRQNNTDLDGPEPKIDKTHQTETNPAKYKEKSKRWPTKEKDITEAIVPQNRQYQGQEPDETGQGTTTSEDLPNNKGDAGFDDGGETKGPSHNDWQGGNEQTDPVTREALSGANPLANLLTNDWPSDIVVSNALARLR